MDGKRKKKNILTWQTKGHFQNIYVVKYKWIGKEPCKMKEILIRFFK